MNTYDDTILDGSTDTGTNKYSSQKLADTCSNTSLPHSEGLGRYRRREGLEVVVASAEGWKQTRMGTYVSHIVRTNVVRI